MERFAQPLAPPVEVIGAGRCRSCGGGGLAGGACLCVVGSESYLFQPLGRKEPAEISSGEAGQSAVPGAGAHRERRAGLG